MYYKHFKRKQNDHIKNTNLNTVPFSYGGPHLHWKVGYAAGGAKVLAEPLRNARHEAGRAKPTAQTCTSNIKINF